MKLKHLNYDKCPTCGARVTTENQDRQHTNGDWNEYVVFECDCLIRYVPNYRREEVGRPCPKSAKEVAKKLRYDTGMKKLRKYIGRLDITEEDKEGLMRYW